MSKITVKGINLKLTDALETHVKDQFKKVLNTFDSLIVEGVVVKLKLDEHHSHINTASILIPVSGNDLQLEEECTDMYRAITKLSQKSSRQLRKLKEKSAPKRGSKHYQEDSIGDED